MRTVRFRYWIGLFALVAFAAAWLLWRRSAEPTADERRRELTELVRAVGAYRPLEARLTGGFAYGAIPADPPVGHVVRDLEPDVRIAIARLEKKAADSAAEEDWAALGTAYVVSGDLDKALQFLEAAAATAVPNPVWLSDLSAIYLAVAERRDRPELLPKALTVAERANRLNGRLREALFNKALALEAIHLNGQAETAWKKYREVDRESPWSQEALAHLVRLQQLRVETTTLWQNVAAAFDAGTDGPYPDAAAIKSVRHRVRGWIETVGFPAWAERQLAGDVDSGKYLQRVRVASELLVAAGGDRMAKDGVLAIDRAVRSAGAPAAVNQLARAHLLLRSAIRLNEASNVAAAAEEAQNAASLFVTAGSPYQHWGTVYRAVAEYAARRFDNARSALRLDSAADVDSDYAYIRGRRKWIAGLILANEGHFLAALARYREAYDALQTTGESNSEASVAALLAEVLGRLGTPSEAWRYQLAALVHASQLESNSRNNLILLEVGGILCTDANLLEAAMFFQNAVLSLSSANQLQRSSGLVEGYFNRAMIAQKLGDVVAAKKDLESARAELQGITDEPLKHRAEAEVFVAEAYVLRSAAPEEAVASASRAIQFFGDSGGQARTVELYLARGRARLAASEHELAERDFGLAIQHFEEQRSRMSDRQYRASVFEYGWQAFEEMARVQVVWRKNASAGLEYAERGRARTLLEASVGSEQAQPLSVRDVQERLPDRTVALFYMTLDDRLLIWAVRAGNISLAERQIGTAILGVRVERLGWLMRQAGLPTTRLKKDLESLFAELIAPVLPFLDDSDTIAIVPDGPLHAVPFAALINSKSGRYLVQDYVVTTAPSLSTLTARRSTPSRHPTGAPRALVIGNPAHRRTADEAWLPDLPFAQEESEAVAAFYQNSLLLTRDKATKRALLANVSQFDVVHYAGHAIVNPQAPGLSRLLIAAESDDVLGEIAEEQGSLFVRELASMRLDRTSLVVLAACSTGSGAVQNGEGVSSIARPFLEAGASNVVATLWDVPDRSAVQLFGEFHRYVAAGQSPAVALARTQRRLIEEEGLTSPNPSHWAFAVSIGALTHQ